MLLEAPDPDTVKADAVGAEKFTKEVVPATAVKSEDPTSCGESWTVSSDPNIRRYGNFKDKIQCMILYWYFISKMSSREYLIS